MDTELLGRLRVLRMKVERLGELAMAKAPQDQQGEVFQLRSDLHRLFNFMGVPKTDTHAGKTLCEVFENERQRTG